MKVSTVDEMRDLDRRAVEEYGIVEDLLMENGFSADENTFLRVYVHQDARR